MSVEPLLDVDAVRRAAGRIAGHVVETPLQRSLTLSEVTGATVAVKFENLQFTGSFKARRAQPVADTHRRRGGSRVVAMSAGNHAQGVAYHAHRLGIAATIAMPETTPFTKVARTRGHGATVELSGDTVLEAAERARELAADDGLTFVHPTTTWR
jgi:threonine dehydratase